MSFFSVPLSGFSMVYLFACSSLVIIFSILFRFIFCPSCNWLWLYFLFYQHGLSPRLLPVFVPSYLITFQMFQSQLPASKTAAGLILIIYMPFKTKYCLSSRGEITGENHKIENKAKYVNASYCQAITILHCLWPMRYSETWISLENLSNLQF